VSEPVTLVLEAWSGPWPDDDPDANFKAEVAAYRLADPLHTLRGLSRAMDIPVGALAHYVLAKYAVAGSEGLLALGSSSVERMWQMCARARADGTEAARLAAFDTLEAMLGWLRVPLEHPGVHGDAAGQQPDVGEAGLTDGGGTG
jgi:Family of unknown function (DUF6027)